MSEQKYKQKTAMQSLLTADDRLSVSIAEAVRLSGISRSSIYNALGEGRLIAVKNGSKTLILLHSLRNLVENLPLATIRTAKKQAA